MPAEQVGVDKAAGHDSHPSARDFFARFDAEKETISVEDQKRQEIIDMGLPDDGYDYLKHLRAIGKTKVGLDKLPNTSAIKAAQDVQEEEATGPSVFLAAPLTHKPAADIKVVDARRVVVDATEDEGAQTSIPKHRVPTKNASGVRLQRLTQQVCVRMTAAMTMPHQA